MEAGEVRVPRMPMGCRWARDGGISDKKNDRYVQWKFQDPKMEER